MNGYLKYILLLKYSFACLFIILINKPEVFCQKQIGIPFIQNYSSKVYKQDPQNWSVCQDKRGIMYFGNTNGLLEYDGTNWRLLKVKNNSAVRTIDIGIDNKIYLGASGEFGYINIGELGKYHYVSLSERLEKINFNAVWNVFYTPEGVYFFAGKSLIYKYINDTIISININPLIKDFIGFKVNETIYAVDSKYGICKVKNDTLKKLNARQEIIKNVYSFFEVGEGKYLLGTRNNGLFIYNEKHSKKDSLIVPFKTEVDKYLKDNNLYSGIKLSNSDYAFATLQGGIVILNQFGELKSILNKSKGLLADDIYYLYTDRNDNMWAAQERGISKIEINSAFTQLNNINGIEGTLKSGIIFNNHLYLGTSIGIYHQIDFNIKTADNPRVIEPISKKYNYVIDFCIIENPGNGNEILLVSALRNILQIYDTTKLKEVITLYACNSMLQSKRIPSRVFLGHPNGISALKVNFSELGDQYTRFEDEGQIADFKYDIRLLCLDKNGDLWISTAYNGLTYIKFADDENLEDFEIYRYRVNAGLPHNDGNKVYNINDKLIISTEKGLYKLEDENLIDSDPGNIRFIPDTSYKLNFEKDSIIVTTLKADQHNNIWFGTNDGVYKYIHRDGMNNELVSYPMKRIAGNDIERIFIEENGIPWFATKEALYRYNFTNRSGFFPNYFALIRKITIAKDSIIFFGNDKYLFSTDKYSGQNLSYKGTLSYNVNSIRFEYSVPSFENEESNVFRYKLEGFDKNWSGWTKEVKKEYTNLSEGNYSFRVKARNIFGTESIEARYGFTIAPPWYRTLFAFILYGILIISLAFFGLEAYSKRLRGSNIRLEKIILGRTSEIEQQKEEIEAQAERLIQTNKELEKLSIIASETDSAIVIMDAKGNFEWINEGFTRLYGYTFEQLIQEKDRNIIGASSNLNIKDLINIWFGDKKAIIYESLNTCKSGEKIWAQTTLTPIIDEKGKIVKLIAIDSDITKLKEAEEKIEMQRDEIKAQRDMAISQRDEISEQKKEITDSIIYAKRIQKALLPSIEMIDKIFNDYFILYKPRDIVSGDFYWFTKLNDKLVIVAADCTGHGVPGAFMSLIGISFLNEIVNSKQVLTAHDILNQLREHIIMNLQHSEDEGEARDGMDIALCILDFKKKEMQYAGANNPLIIIRNKQMIEVKPDKMPIGRHRLSGIPFRNNMIKLEKNDTMYLFTDGYVDQFGGLNDKKFKSHNFKKLLLEIQDFTIPKQKSILNNKFEEWRGNAEQVDDILIIGFKLSELT